MSDVVEQIKSRLDVVDVLSEYLKVQKSGANFKARCPFHNEKTPSFYISPERQIWHCFGCSAGGDIFGFIKQIEGVEFPEALRTLAKKAGVQLEQYNPKVRDDKAKLYEICELASKFFEKQLKSSSTGQKALQYLISRGVRSETIDEFRLGFAPDDWHALGAFLKDRGYSSKEIIAAGLMVDNEGRQYDRFRSRITFPIADLSGQIVGFTGRIFEDVPTRKAVGIPTSDFNQATKELDKNQSVGAKYINTPQTAIYDKSRILYGLDKSRLNVKAVGRCLLVEGNMDALMSYQAGVNNVVATSGTALTQSHLTLLKRYADNLDFCFDTDQAGALATRRGIGLALGQNFNVNIVAINDKECKDPADYVKKYGERWGDAVKSAKPVIEFYFDKATANFDQSVASKKLLVGVLAPLIKRLESRVEKAHWISRLAGFLRVKEELVEADIGLAKDDLAAYEPYEIQPKSSVSVSLAEAPLDVFNQTLASLVMRNPNLLKGGVKIDETLLDPRVALFIKTAATSGTEADGKKLIARAAKGTNENSNLALEFAYLKSQELWNDFKDSELADEFHGIYNKIRHRKISQQLAELELDIKQAELGKESGKVAELAGKFSKLAVELASIQNEKTQKNQ